MTRPLGYLSHAGRPQRTTVYTSGAGTHTLLSSAVWARVTLVGGGGGGGSGGTTTAAAPPHRGGGGGGGGQTVVAWVRLAATPTYAVAAATGQAFSGAGADGGATIFGPLMAAGGGGGQAGLGNGTGLGGHGGGYVRDRSGSTETAASLEGWAMSICGGAGGGAMDGYGTAGRAPGFGARVAAYTDAATFGGGAAPITSGIGNSNHSGSGGGSSCYGIGATGATGAATPAAGATGYGAGGGGGSFAPQAGLAGGAGTGGLIIIEEWAA